MSGREDSGGGSLQPEGNSESKQDVSSWAQADVVGSRSSRTENLRARIFNGRRVTAVKVKIGAKAGKQGEGKSDGHAGPGRLPGVGSPWRLGICRTATVRHVGAPTGMAPWDSGPQGCCDGRWGTSRWEAPGGARGAGTRLRRPSHGGATSRTHPPEWRRERRGRMPGSGRGGVRPGEAVSGGHAGEADATGQDGGGCAPGRRAG